MSEPTCIDCCNPVPFHGMRCEVCGPIADQWTDVDDDELDETCDHGVRWEHPCPQCDKEDRDA